MPTDSRQRSEAKKVTRKQKPPRVPHLRTSERAAFKRCGYKWWWAWRDGLTPAFAANSLWFGEGIHLALASWYLRGKKRGPHPAETFATWVGAERRRIFTQPKVNVDESEIVDAKELGVAMLNSYVDAYGKDSRYHFLATEHSFQLDIPQPLGLAAHPTTRQPVLVEYDGTYDGVFRDEHDGTIWLIEHKTAKSISTRHLPLDDQAGSYWMTATSALRDAKLIGPKEHLEGILYNFLRKAKPDTRDRDGEGQYLNKDGTVSRSQPAPYFLREPVFRLPKELRTQLSRIQDESFTMSLVRNGELPILKNPTKDCSWDCPFLDMCQLHESGEDWEGYRDNVFSVQDPYADHRKSTAE